jgi:hypothetical protein
MLFHHLFSCNLGDDIQMLANIVMFDLMWTYLISWAIFYLQLQLQLQLRLKKTFIVIDAQQTNFSIYS